VEDAHVRRDLTRARLIGVLTALGGLLLVVSTLPILRRRVENVAETFTPFGVRVTSHVVALGAGAALLYLAGQLSRRRHLAWILALVLFGASTIVNVLRVHHDVAAVYSFVMVGLLLVSRKQFSAPGDPPTFFEFIRFVPWYLLGVFAYGFAALYLERESVTPEPTFWNSLETILLGLVGLDGPYTYQRRFFEWAFPVSLLVLGIGGLAWALVLLFRPIVARPEADTPAWEKAIGIVREHSRDTLDYFALRNDKLFFFSSDGKAMIAYTYVGRHALASGDPVGAPESVPLVIDEFLAMCRNRAWGVAFLAARESDRQMYLDRGLHTVYLGDEAIVRCDGFSLQGKKWKSVRQSSGRIERTYRFVWMPETDASPELIANLNDISRRWRGKAPERGFTMTLSQDVEGTNPAFFLCIALDENDEPGGFLRVVPVFGPEPGYTLDLMRRDPDTPNGMTEFLLTRTVMKLDELGYDRFSMNFAAWGRFFEEDVEYSLRQRGVKLVLDLMSPFYQIKSLKEFNQRFYPEWVPRCIVYDDFRDLPKVALLYSSAEGFLHIPVIGRYFLPRTIGEPGHPIVEPDPHVVHPRPTRVPSSASRAEGGEGASPKERAEGSRGSNGSGPEGETRAERRRRKRTEEEAARAAGEPAGSGTAAAEAPAGERD
jgi:lysyl-tRNA synthetase class 2